MNKNIFKQKINIFYETSPQMQTTLLFKKKKEIINYTLNGLYSFIWLLVDGKRDNRAIYRDVVRWINVIEPKVKINQSHVNFVLDYFLREKLIKVIR